MKYLTLLLALSALALTGCATLGDDNQQGRAGITDVAVDWTPDEQGVPRLSGVRWIDGKEKQGVSLSISLPNGTEVRYQAQDVTAFEGQAVRGQVAAALADAGVAVTPALIDGIVKSLTGIR